MNRKSITLTALTLLSAVLALASQAALADTMNVKLKDATDGQEKNLNQIEDIVTITGNSFPEVRRQSLLLWHDNAGGGATKLFCGTSSRMTQATMSR